MVVRGLDENADEEMLHYEFSKHAPIKVQNAETVLWFALAFLMCKRFTDSKFAGSSSCQGQIYTCFKGICVCAFSFGMIMVQP